MPPRSYERIVERYVARIVDGEIAPGEPLPREQDLAAEFALSRGVAREGIRALQERGMITVTHGRGQRANEPAEWKVFDPDVLAAMLTRADAQSFLRALVECRLIAEVDAAGLAAQRARRPQLDVLESRFAALPTSTGGRAADRADALAAERAFHQAVLDASGNAALAQMVRPVLAALEQAGDLLPPRKAAHAERRRIVEAIGAHDPDGAREAMRTHLRGVLRAVSRR